MKSNVAQTGHTWMAYDWGIDKATVIFAGMAGGLQPEEALIWLFQGEAPRCSSSTARISSASHRFRAASSRPRVFLHSKKRIETLEDFQGLKMRTAGAWAEIAGNLGASTVILPGAEVYPALERGVIDATEWSSASVNLPSGFHKIAKYIITPGIHQPAAVQECVFNMDAWNGLTDQQRETLKFAGQVMALDTYTRYPTTTSRGGGDA